MLAGQASDDAARDMVMQFVRVWIGDFGQAFLVTQPFGEQCFQSSWRAPVHANLMFGGVVFGRTTFNMRRRDLLYAGAANGRGL